jgi:hypothetical protein
MTATAAAIGDDVLSADKGIHRRHRNAQIRPQVTFRGWLQEQ